MESQADAQFKPPCPYCRGEGTPRVVTIEHYLRTVTFVCLVCNRCWTATDDPLFPLAPYKQPSM
jgi:hypothetical protein